ncbi:MAG: SDR family NAD(P)-dependent oxidoreductase [Oribacterium sp.]|nr:SDR family NAD(P)-dependent oxidoreductase [Oribacterium sp.]
MKKYAIVTGASSGIGRAVSFELLAMGYDVFGFGRDFAAWQQETGCRECVTSYETPGFHPVVCDLLDTKQLMLCLDQILKTPDGELTVLVNNAGAAYYGLHEEMNPEKIMEMVRVNLEVPMILTQKLLRSLKKNHGAVINISSVTAISSSPHGACYGATKAGLLSFSRSLFDEVRKYGVRVTAVLPDMTDTALYRNADFEADPQWDAHLNPEDVAGAVRYALSVREGSCVPEIMIRPQLHRIHRKPRT